MSPTPVLPRKKKKNPNDDGQSIFIFKLLKMYISFFILLLHCPLKSKNIIIIIIFFYPMGVGKDKDFWRCTYTFVLGNLTTKEEMSSKMFLLRERKKRDAGKKFFFSGIRKIKSSRVVVGARRELPRRHQQSYFIIFFLFLPPLPLLNLPPSTHISSFLLSDLPECVPLFFSDIIYGIEIPLCGHISTSQKGSYL